MAGMGLAILTTLVGAPPAGIGAWALVILGLAVGGGAGAYIARQVPMTAMPQLVAAFHSLVGLAAVLVAAAALYAPQAFGIGQPGHIPEGSLFEMALGVAIGAITFTGSIIAFLKLDGRMSGKPIMLPSRHLINIALGVLLRGAARGLRPRREPGGVLARRARQLRARRAAHRADRRRRHAGRDLDAQLLFGMGCGRHRLHARESGADHHRRARRLLRRDPVLHHVPRHEPELHLGHPRRLRRRDRGAGRQPRRRGRSSRARRTMPPSS